MCALKKHISTEDPAIIHARDALQLLINASPPDAQEISTAIDALETLRARLSTARHVHQSVRESKRRQIDQRDATAAHLHRLDSEIIQAKMDASELLSERDSVARDLVWAKRSLERLDAGAEEMRREKSEKERYGQNGQNVVGGRDKGDKEDLERLLRMAEGEMGRMRIVEEKLMDVVEELNGVRKRKLELQEKIRMAHDEW